MLSLSMALTGINIVWLLLAAFTLMTAGGAMWRILPHGHA